MINLRHFIAKLVGASTYISWHKILSMVFDYFCFNFGPKTFTYEIRFIFQSCENQILLAKGFSALILKKNQDKQYRR